MSAAGPDGSPIDRVIDGGAVDVIAEGDPVAAEAWASHLLGTFDSLRLEARLAGQEVPPFEEVVLERCAARRDQPALVVATALAAVVPPPLDETARQVAAILRQSSPGPPWLEAVGRAQPTRAWIASDVFDDQDSLIVGFVPPGAAGEHSIVVLVDHNLSGQAKDAWLAAGADEVAAAFSSTDDRHMRVEQVPVDAALARLGNAMAMSDLWNGDHELRSDDFAENRALVWALLRRAGAGHQTVEHREVPQEERDALVADFLASDHGTAARTAIGGHHDVVELLARSLVDLRCNYEGRPLRWSPIVVQLLLVDQAPRKLLLDPDQAAALPSVLRAFVRFAGERTGLDPVFVEEILDAVTEVESQFVQRMADPLLAGPAKALLTALQARGVSLDDPDAVAAALDQLGPVTLPSPAGGPRPKPADASPAVVEAAAGATVLTRFALLVDFFGDGRKLTQTGQPTLADARALVSLLGTQDHLDSRIGERTFKTRSAAELPELAFVIRWAIAAGVLRKEHGRLRATASWRKLDGRPLERWLKACDALLKLGPLAGYHARSRYRNGPEVVDELMAGMLHSLRAGSRPFDAVLDEICREADLRYEWLAPYLQDGNTRRRTFGYDLDLMLRILGWAGILRRTGETVTPDTWLPGGQRLEGGTVELTAPGRWWLGGR